MGERKWGDDFRRRMMMFQSMIESILMYGEEIWGCKEQEEVEELPETYLRWVLVVKRNATLHGEERVQEEKVEGESGKDSGKVWEQNGGREESRILMECWRKKKELGKEREKERERSIIRGTDMPVKKRNALWGDRDNRAHVDWI
jgi:hypothetical protein